MSDFVIKNGVLEKYTGESTEVIIPKKVTEIKKLAFEKCNEIETVYIADGVERIDEYAFKNCGSLESIHVPKSLSTVYVTSFRGCNNLNKVFIEDMSYWYKNGFGNCIPVAYELYIDDKLVENLVIPEGVTKIHEGTFQNNSGIKSVSLPDSLTEICNNAFIKCHIESIYINNLNAWCKYGFGKSFNSKYNLYINAKSANEITIPDGITEIKSDSFSNCKNLVSVILPDSVKKTGARAFKNCVNLKSVVLPKNISSIADNAFDGCSKINSISSITVLERKSNNIKSLIYDNSTLSRHKFVCPYCSNNISYFTITYKPKNKIIPDIDGYCPKCKNPLSFAAGFYSADDGSNSKAEFPDVPEMDKKVSSFIDSRKNSSIKAENKHEYNIDDPEKLKEYLKNALDIENSIEVLCKLLNKAYFYQFASKNISEFFEQKLLTGVESEKQIISQRLKNIEKTIPDDETIARKIDELMISIKPVQPDEPKIKVLNKPVYSESDLELKPEIKPELDEPVSKTAKPVAPVEPTYIKVHFFNKKKATAKNEESKNAYQRELASYEEKLKEYNRQRALIAEWQAYKYTVAENERIRDKAKELYKHELEQYKTEQEYNNNLQKEYDLALEKYKADCEEFDKAIENIRNSEIKNAEDALKEKEKLENDLAISNKAVVDVKKQIKDGIKEKKYQIYWDLEVERIQNLLIALINARNALYSTNTLYKKYRHLAAISTIYEYIVSGRCSKLTGPDGAYNLYESETRADMIISRLDNVLVSLDTIKKNQFVLIEQLKEIQHDIKTVGEEIVSSLNNIEERIGEVNESIKIETAMLKKINGSIKNATEQISSKLETGNGYLSDISESSSWTAAMSTVSAAANIATAYNTKQIALNTAETAFYSKVNAQLQHTANYLIALK